MIRPLPPLDEESSSPLAASLAPVGSLDEAGWQELLGATRGEQDEAVHQPRNEAWLPDVQHAGRLKARLRFMHAHRSLTP